MLTNSLGKCNSIRDIVFHEYEASGQDLRLLVLTDYIRKEYEKAIEIQNTTLNSLGVLPFFEMLRRDNEKKNEQIRFWGALWDDCDHSGRGKRSIRAGDRNERKSYIQQDRKSF